LTRTSARFGRTGPQKDGNVTGLDPGRVRYGLAALFDVAIAFPELQLHGAVAHATIHDLEHLARGVART